EILDRNEMLSTLRRKTSELERASFADQRETLQKRISELESFIKQTGELAKGIHETNRKVIATEAENLKAFLGQATAINQEQKSRLESYQRLRSEKLASDDSVRNAQRAYDDGRLKIRELELQREQLAFREVQLAESDLQSRNLLATREDTLARLRMQLKELDNRDLQVTKRDQEADLRDENEIRQLQRDIERLDRQLQADRDIRSEFSGRVLEITAAEGSVVNVGQRLVQLTTREDTDELIALAYFPDKIGKSLVTGMPVRVSPSTVDNKQYGNIQGEIVSITEYPVTADAVANYVGNSLLAQQLTAGGHQIEVKVALRKDASNPSGFAWTSRRGADVAITAGTSAEVWATYERRAPISYVLPKLRQWTGLALSSKFEVMP
ncbi:MAG: NHLP bacteriocin system secretion protein, partial [Vicinamibacterales bacterium]